MHRLTCQACSIEFESRTRNGKFCQPKCQWTDSRAKRKASGSTAAWRAKNKDKISAYRKDVSCAACGAALRRRHTSGRRPACDSRCRRYLQDLFWPHSKIPTRHASRRPRERARFAAGSCAHCSASYLVDRLAGYNLLDRYCSQRCGAKAQRAVRRARKKAAYVEPVRRSGIYERDAWICLLCGDPIERSAEVPHPLAATLDHVIPLARGGAHSEENLQTAHFLCNSRKGDRITECLTISGSSDHDEPAGQAA